ncbi:MAG TPA: formate dehydrogenase accessory sulfurtransferase FdhD [Gemmatimonadaceae bacterium]|nr:formate dehydrogenase accessory sulfurtransferase FdhD [Gemmatimonadaceae bacterium]
MANSTLGYSAPTAPHAYLRVGDDASTSESAPLAAEVPVALVYNARPHVVMMCTPEDLEDFAYGFTITEQIATIDEVRRVEVVKYARGIELQIEVAAEVSSRLDARGRAMVARTGCGLCGVEVIDAAMRDLAPVRAALTVTRDALWHASAGLDSGQSLNREVHAIHAAAWATAAGDVRVTREDVGRHNALDKVIGALAREGIDPSAGFALVTSRASYELVQKSAVANVALLAAVSRPTALAVQLADSAGITLVGLLRGHTANVYTHPSRIADASLHKE